MLKASLSYDRGTIIIIGMAHAPYATFDPRTDSLRAPALHYSALLEYMRQSDIECKDSVLDLLPSEHLAAEKLALRDYQEKALDSWTRAGMRGCVVLPTGSGKTVIAVKAVEKVNSSALVVVPTLDLMAQWTDVLSKYYPNAKIGNLGGGSDDIQALTVATYDSAYIRAPLLGNKFSLVIFDEVHHLAAPGFRSIAEQMAAPYRLGLTATIEREDEMHKDIPKLVGGIVFQASPTMLAKDKHLAQFIVERRQVEMTDEEKEEYQRNFGIYQTCLKKLGLRMQYAGAFRRLIMMSGKNSVAREGLLARNKAMQVA